jgi:hypothetical protein
MPDDGDTRLLRHGEPRLHLRGVDVDDDGVDALRHGILDPADHGGDVACGVDDVDVPAVALGRSLEPVDVELRSGLREIGRDHRHPLLRRCSRRQQGRAHADQYVLESHVSSPLLDRSGGACPARPGWASA